MLRCFSGGADRPRHGAKRVLGGTLTPSQLKNVFEGTSVVVEDDTIGRVAGRHIADRVGKVYEREESVGSTRGTDTDRRATDDQRDTRAKAYRLPLPDPVFRSPPVFDAMYVIKRNGQKEPVSFDKITRRMKRLADDPFQSYRNSAWSQPIKIVVDADPHVTGEALCRADPVKVSQKVCSQLYNGISTRELDDLSSETAIAMATSHQDYGVLASRIAVSNLHKETPNSLKESFRRLGPNRIDPQVYEAVVENEDLNKKIEEYIDYTKDYQCDYFAIKTLMRVYLLTDACGRIVERPQHMYMRAALGIHGPENIEDVLSTYRHMSERFYTHATPTLFNAGTSVPQNSSCYLYGIDPSMDSIEGIFDTLKKCALISKYGGGIGLHVHGVRAKGSKIKSTNGTSTGIAPMLKMFNDLARYVNQCCSQETIVYCKRGPKQIKDVDNQDQVLTRDGTFRNVEVVIKRSEDKFDALQICTATSQTRWTPDHQILTLRNGREEYVKASDLRVGDHLFFPIPRERAAPIADPRRSRFEGICIAVSCAPENFCLKLPDTRDFVKEYVADQNEQGNVSVGAIDPKNHLHKGRRDVECVLHGILETVGTPSPKAYIVETGSEELVGCVNYMLLRMGVLPGVTRKGASLTMRIPRHPNLARAMPDGKVLEAEDVEEYVKDGCLLAQITDIEPVKFTGDLYDLHVDENHNYLTETGLVSNSGKRQGSIAIYLEPWHADIMTFLNLKRNQGMEEDRARDLFYAVWVPDLFMKRVKDNKMWALFCPTKAPRLSDTYGEEFERLYQEYEKDDGRVAEFVPAREIWNAMTTSQIETGVPYVLFKDACNRKSNQKNLGTIKSSNLCTEIVEYSDANECAVCNLASVSLPKFVKKEPLTGTIFFDYDGMHEIVKEVVRNLNMVIDRGYYPIKEAETSNKRHRPIGIGVQGLSDVFFMMSVPFDGKEAKKINRDIFETIYHAAVEASVELARVHGPYYTFPGSPASQGILQYDMWNVVPGDRYDWAKLKNDMKIYGLRNSLLVAPMPTASTAQIFGNSEGFEPVTSNMFVRKTLAGEFLVVNKYLVRDLMKAGLWNNQLKDAIVRCKGSVQNIEEIPAEMKAVYKTAFEMKMKAVVDMAADRGAFICQSQSLNLFVANPSHATMSSMLFYAWEKGLKTGQYYLRSLPATDPLAVTVLRNDTELKQDQDSCVMCSA